MYNTVKLSLEEYKIVNNGTKNYRSKTIESLLFLMVVCSEAMKNIGLSTGKSYSPLHTGFWNSAQKYRIRR